MNTETTRAELKARAKETLKGKYWYAFGFSILTAVITGIPSCITTPLQQMAGENISLAFLAVILAWAGILFVTIPLGVGSTRFFINIAKGREPQVYDLFYVYKHGLGNTILTGLLESIYIFLWSLLFIIPGIIKTYQYFMIEYMLAENPNFNRKRAFEITKTAMSGNKWKAFVLGLSFIGWELLCILTLGIGFFFLAPYISSTMAHYYLDLKEKAIADGIAQAEEFNA